ncbi:unnamed protein product [Dovyalis caffra]|uniref:Uncharacterized protein n=1 Tax=Dovyalis caffra TaxID=77055 RepID=A0AAV1RIY4_9ROSI|nr:unnamed protein product [Dovyalis caffra]
MRSGLMMKLTIYKSFSNDVRFQTISPTEPRMPSRNSCASAVGLQTEAEIQEFDLCDILRIEAAGNHEFSIENGSNVNLKPSGSLSSLYNAK